MRIGRWRGRALFGHPATMPPESAERRVLADSHPRRDEVLDPFAGSGTTALAATGLVRWATLVESSPDRAAMRVSGWGRSRGGRGHGDAFPRLDRLLR